MLDDTLYSVASPRERALRRARLAGLEIVSCQQCGGVATLERLQSIRPNQPARWQTVVRCLEKAGCSVQVHEELVHEEPEGGGENMDSLGQQNGGPPAERDVGKESEMVQKQEKKLCECGCGQPVADGDRFFSRGCLGRYARQFRGQRRRPNGPSFAPEEEDELTLVYEAMRSLRKLPPAARRKALELLESLENTGD